MWYRWTSPFTGSAFFDTSGTGISVVLAVYTGTNLAELAPVISAPGFFTASVRFQATVGTEYRIAIDGYSGGEGSVVLNWTSNPAPANDAFAAAAPLAGASDSLSTSNLGASKEVGEPAHAGSAGGSSVWYRWTAPATGSAYFETSGASIDLVLGVYTGTDVATLTTVTSRQGFSATR